MSFLRRSNDDIRIGKEVLHTTFAFFNTQIRESCLEIKVRILVQTQTIQKLIQIINGKVTGETLL